MKPAFILFFFLGSGLFTAAQTEHFMQMINGSLRVGDSCTVYDDKFIVPEKWADVENNQSVSDLISFELRLDTAATYLQRKFSCTLTFDIRYETADHVIHQLRNVQLKTDFDSSSGTTYQSVNWYKFTDGHKVTVKITGITSDAWGSQLPPLFRVKNEIYVERTYRVNRTVQIRTAVATSPAARAGDNSPGDPQVIISWDAGTPGFPEYDLEWLFCDDQGATAKRLQAGAFNFSRDSMAALFSHNASRVTVSMPSYTLNLVYPEGWIFYRVRGARYDPVTGERLLGEWSYEGSYSYNGNGYAIIRSAGHEPSLNWQYDIDFSEGGKRKERVSYFDGTLRTRQTVAMNADGTAANAVVTENIPDAQGRPAVRVMPAPVPENTIHFFPDFNLNSAGAAYSYRDISSLTCQAMPPAMLRASGASKYYSPMNPMVNDKTREGFFSKYIPDADGYPFTTMLYTADNTGRVQNKGYTSATFQPNAPGNHTTRYFYGKPLQEELDRLFGNEAGNASHYQKNLAIDPNGQVTVAYLNASGKVVASGMAGKAPINVLPLSGLKSSDKEKISLLSAEDNIVRDPATLSLYCNTSFLITGTGSFDLNYEFTPLSLQVLYGIDNASICADCFYDISIAVTDDCGNIVGSGNEDAAFSEKIACSPSPTKREGTVRLNIPGPGAFHLSFKLSLSQKAIDFYTDRYLVENSALVTESGFQHDYLHKIDLSGCFNNCSTCMNELGSPEHFLQQMLLVLQKQGISPTKDDTTWIQKNYQELLDECSRLQLGCGKTAVPCEEQTLQMKEDLRPGGQYMLFDQVTKRFVERDINVFLKHRTSLVATVGLQGKFKALGSLSEAELIDNWKDEWADLLLPFHPENTGNCFIDDCFRNAASTAYEQQLLQLETASSAIAGRFWFRDDIVSVVNNDPYFATDSEGASKKALFINRLLNYRNTGTDIMGFVRWNVYCGHGASTGNTPANIIPCPRTVACNREDDEWNLFKVLYYAARVELQDKQTNCTSDLLFPSLQLQIGYTANDNQDFVGSQMSRDLFEPDTSGGSLKLLYTGNLSTTGDVTVGYLFVDTSGRLESGTVVLPAGSAPGSQIQLPPSESRICIVDFARLDPRHPYYGKTRRNFNGVNLSATASQVHALSSDSLNNTATAGANSNCNNACEQRADMWMQQLQGCHLEINSANYNAIRDGILAVCNASCSADVMSHPFGAVASTTATMMGDRNVRDVLVRVLGEPALTEICNDLLVDFTPLGQDPIFYSNEQVRTLSDCAYRQLMQWKAAWVLQSTVHSFHEFIVLHYDPAFSLTDAEIDLLIAAYENTCLTPRSYILPASLSCSTAQPSSCITCEMLRDAMADFHSGYPFADSSSPAYYDLLAAYLGRRYNTGISSVDIATAFRNCSEFWKMPGDTMNCLQFANAVQQFERLRPAYRLGDAEARALYRQHLVLWLNASLHRDADWDFYAGKALACGVAFNYPVSIPACDTVQSNSSCPPSFLTCCDRFYELDRFRDVFPGEADARLLALFFYFQRSQPCVAVNLPSPDINLSYDALVSWFSTYKVPGGFHLTVRPDSLIAFTIDTTISCNATAIGFMPAPIPELKTYAFCRKPLQPILPTSEMPCVEGQIQVALINAHEDYLEYRRKVTRDYREAYFTKCLSVTPLIRLRTNYNEPYEYQFTLYYYDQAGNLVKTVPPAGVQPADEDADGQARMKRINDFRLASKGYCYQMSDAPSFSGNASITLPESPAIKQYGAPLSVEGFFRFNDPSAEQVLLKRESVNPVDNKIDGYRLYIKNGRLMADIATHGRERWVQLLSRITNYPWPSPYTNLPPVPVRTKVNLDVPRDVYRSVSVQLTSDFSASVKAGQWVHLAMLIGNSPQHPIDLFVNGNRVSTSEANRSSQYVPAASPGLSAADQAAGTTEIGFSFVSVLEPFVIANDQPADFTIGAATDGFNGSAKQIRVYNRLLPEGEIRANAANSCLLPQNNGQLLFWLVLAREETAGHSVEATKSLLTNNNGTVFSSDFQPVYPAHRQFVTTRFNSLQRVIERNSEDAGTVNTFFDAAGRVIASQTSEQKNPLGGGVANRYTYTKYDRLGRMIETGEKSGGTTMNTLVAFTDPFLAGSALAQWYASGSDRSIVQTIYDQPDVQVVVSSRITSLQNFYNTSRKRMVTNLYRETHSPAADYNNAVHYQYDISGNVKRVWQEIRKASDNTPVNAVKELLYDYDLISQKVNSIVYQPGKGDQYVYKYEYDAANRLLTTASGREFNTLRQDAGYRYYLHGPLARSELGDPNSSSVVQGLDFAYTLQGWLRGINKAAPGNNEPETDMGEDGTPLSGRGLHSESAKDVFSMGLGYFPADYKPIGSNRATAFNLAYAWPQAGTALTGNPQYNAHPSNAVYAIAGINAGAKRGYTYGYDQIGRIRELRAHAIEGKQWDNGSILNDHLESFGYDANGNIDSLVRNGTTAAGRIPEMDRQQFHYYYRNTANAVSTYLAGTVPADSWVLSNRLARIADAVPAANYPAPTSPSEKDIDDQPFNNYFYDGVGNLLQDVAEGIRSIRWTPFGKIKSIVRNNGVSISYDYDAMGNRIQQEVRSAGSRNITWYLRDVSGNTMAVYSWKGKLNESPQALAEGEGIAGAVWEEQHLYGNSRLGMWKPAMPVPVVFDVQNGAIQTGTKFFEVSNNTGNVLAVISDKKKAIASETQPGLADHYEAEVVKATDYTAFGMQMAGRHFSVAPYRYGFNGKENDDAAKGEGEQQDYGMRIYDPRAGRFLSVDPLDAEYPMLSPYQFASNFPIGGIDRDGLEYSPAGRVGIFNIDGTAVQLYHNNPEVIYQQKQEAPMLARFRLADRAHYQPTAVSTQWQPATEFERERFQALKAVWYDNDGYNADGTPKPGTKLAQNKTWQKFADNIALPILEGFTWADGIGEFKLTRAAWLAIGRLSARERIAAGIEIAMSKSIKEITDLDSKALIGYRGSLATGTKFSTGAPFTAKDFDVDAFIVSDKLAAQFPGDRWFRSGLDITGVKEVSSELQFYLSRIPGYRVETGKSFTFRIFTVKEYLDQVFFNGFKLLKP